MLDTLHAYFGLVSTVKARRLEAQSCRCKYFIRRLVLICPKSWSIYSYLIVTFVVDIELELKRALAVKKTAAFQSKAGSSSAPVAKMSLKRKNQVDRGRMAKKTVNQPVISDPTCSQGILTLLVMAWVRVWCRLVAPSSMNQSLKPLF